MTFVEKLRVPGFKRWIRDLVWVKLKTPLIPRCFFEYEEGRSVWVDFMFEGVFRFCKRCGKIGHNMIDCTVPWNHVRSEVNREILKASDLRIMYGREDAPLYSNKIKGVLDYDVFRSTRVPLGALPFLNYFSGSDYDRHGGGDSVDDGDDEAGPSCRRRRRKCFPDQQFSNSSSSPLRSGEMD